VHYRSSDKNDKLIKKMGL